MKTIYVVKNIFKNRGDCVAKCGTKVEIIAAGRGVFGLDGVAGVRDTAIVKREDDAVFALPVYWLTPLEPNMWIFSPDNPGLMIDVETGQQSVRPTTEQMQYMREHGGTHFRYHLYQKDADAAHFEQAALKNELIELPPPASALALPAVDELTDPACLTTD